MRNKKMFQVFRSFKALAGRGVRTTYRGLLAAFYGARARGKRQTGDIRSMLIVRGDAIGDFVLFLPALRILRRHFAGAKLSLLVGRESAELASAFAPVDEVISFDRKRYRFNLAYRVRLIQSLRARQFDMAVNPVYSREPLTDELLYCCGARERIAFDGDLNNIGIRTKTKNNRYCTRILPSRSGLMHEADRNREFVEGLTGAQGSREDFQPSLPLSEAQLGDARTLLHSQGLDPQSDLIVAMFPGALNPIRMWPAERFAQLANFIARDFGARILLCGSASERESTERISRLAHIAPASVVGKTTLTQLAGVLRFSALYIGNESGPLHLAVAAGTPSLCVLGGGHFGRFYPYPGNHQHRAVFETMPCYHCNWKCVYEVPHCIHDIPVENVWESVQRMFEDVVLPERSALRSQFAGQKPGWGYS
ncbi:MAG TPA: glycosyltransferase family 9 protein [Candidatus Acidoferrum sp.]|nr:glycosyltransferase family 9 protein [Candidatus Acidoferrum sp.]